MGWITTSEWSGSGTLRAAATVRVAKGFQINIPADTEFITGRLKVTAKALVTTTEYRALTEDLATQIASDAANNYDSTSAMRITVNGPAGPDGAAIWTTWQTFEGVGGSKSIAQAARVNEADGWRTTVTKTDFGATGAGTTFSFNAQGYSYSATPTSSPMKWYVETV